MTALPPCAALALPCNCSVVETQTGKHKVDKVRTSKGTFLRRGHDAVIANIEERVRLLCVSNKLKQACFAGAIPHMHGMLCQHRGAGALLPLIMLLQYASHLVEQAAERTPLCLRLLWCFSAVLQCMGRVIKPLRLHPTCRSPSGR